MFDSWDCFLRFKTAVLEESRYFHSEAVQRFLSGLLTSAQDRAVIIPEGRDYWRAQLGCDEDPVACDAVPFTAERMKPSGDKACEGRVNPKGIPCLYLSEDERTAISEVRPWVGSYVTVGRFETVRDLKIVACRSEIDPLKRSVYDLDKLFKVMPQEAEETTRIVWRWVDLAFSEPIDRNDHSPDYVPTQIVAELFKTNGFDGIEYRSVFNGGSNLALFDCEAAKQTDARKVIQVANLDVGYLQKWPRVWKAIRKVQ